MLWFAEIVFQSSKLRLLNTLRIALLIQHIHQVELFLTFDYSHFLTEYNAYYKIKNL